MPPILPKKPALLMHVPLALALSAIINHHISILAKFTTLVKEIDRNYGMLKNKMNGFCQLSLHTVEGTVLGTG